MVFPFSLVYSHQSTCVRFRYGYSFSSEWLFSAHNTRRALEQFALRHSFPRVGAFPYVIYGFSYISGVALPEGIY
jgi:hypothetical protein